MESQSLLLPLEKLLAQANNLLQLAETEDWVALEAGVAEFEKAAGILNDSSYLQSLLDAGLGDVARELVGKIMQLNDRLDNSATETRGKVSSELRQIIQSGKALSAYGR